MNKPSKRTRTLINLAFLGARVLKSKPGAMRRFLNATWEFLDEVPVTKKEDTSDIIDVYGQPCKECSMCGEYVLIQNLEYGDVCHGCAKKKEK